MTPSFNLQEAKIKDAQTKLREIIKNRAIDDPAVDHAASLFTSLKAINTLKPEKQQELFTKIEELIAPGGADKYAKDHPAPKIGGFFDTGL